MDDPRLELVSALETAKRYADFISDDQPPEVSAPSVEQLGDALLVLAQTLYARSDAA